MRELRVRLLTWAPSATERSRPVLLLHGFADTAATWAPVAEVLCQQGHRVLAPDLRGFGKSGWAGAGGYYHFPDYVADVDALTDALAIKELALVGHSMGGTVAALYAGSRPQRVQRLALLEGLGPPDNDPSHTPERFTRWLDDLADGGRKRQKTMTFDQALDRLARQHVGVPREVLAQKLPDLMHEIAPGAFHWHLDPLHRTTAPYPFLAASYRAFASRVRCPVLLLHGGADGFHPPDEHERIAAFPSATVASIDGAGHMMHWTRPDAVARALLPFLDQESR